MPQYNRDLTKPVSLPTNPSTISPHERHVARFRAEDARTGAQTDERTPTVRFRRPKVRFPKPDKVKKK